MSKCFQTELTKTVVNQKDRARQQLHLQIIC